MSFSQKYVVYYDVVLITPYLLESKPGVLFFKSFLGGVLIISSVPGVWKILELIAKSLNT